mgnify:FL=1
MEQAVPAGKGSMAAVLGLNASEIETAISGTKAEIANYNCPGQIVITGPKEAVEEAAVKLKEAGARRVLPLTVSGPFHSSMLLEAGKKLEKELEKVAFSKLKIPYMTNVTAQPVTDIKETKGLLAKQISSSVRWQQSIENMIRDGVNIFVEIGPGKTLTGFMRKIAPDIKTYNIEKTEDIQKVLEGIEQE